MSREFGCVTTLFRPVTVSVTSKASVKPRAASAAALIGSIRSTPRPVTRIVPVYFSTSSVPACCASPPPSSSPPQAASRGPMLRAPAAPSPPLTKERRVSPLRCMSSNQSRSLIEQLLSPPHGRWDYVDGPRRPANGNCPNVPLPTWKALYTILRGASQQGSVQSRTSCEHGRTTAAGGAAHARTDEREGRGLGAGASWTAPIAWRV